MELDIALTMEDRGLSAFHRRNVTRGALGVFLAAVDDGAVPVGSVLVVEGLDRLSRAEPILAQAQLAQIINAGITVVTASDGHEYNRERLRSQPMDLVYSLLVMIRAYEESATKSTRVRAAIHRECQAWIAGTWRGVVRNGKDPHWVELVDGRFRLLPARVAAVRRMVELFMAGHGGVGIVRQLQEEGLQLSHHGNGAQQIYRIVRNRALIGDKVLTVDGQEYRLAGYYPPALPREQFDTLQALVDQRHRRKGKGDITGLITGLGIARCGYCGEAMIGQNLMTRRRRADGRPNNGHRRIICAGYSKNAGCLVPGSCSVVPIEHALMHFCSDQMNLSRLMTPATAQDSLTAQLDDVRQSITATSGQIERVMDAMLADDDGESPMVFRRRARALENQLEQLKSRERTLERELRQRRATPPPAVSEAWARLVAGVEALDPDARLQARQLVADTFERIVIYQRGIIPQPSRSWSGTIDLLLVARHGTTRILHIDRRTGAWRAGEELNIAGSEIPLPGE